MPVTVEGVVRRSGLVVLAGSAAGFGVSFGLTPVIARLFSPEVFGTFAAVTAVASVFVGVSTLRLEVLSQAEVDEDGAQDLLVLALVGTTACAALLTLATAVAVLVLPASPWWLALGPLVAVSSLQLVGSSALTRSGGYRELAVGNFVQGAVPGLVQVLLGWVGWGVTALVAGFAAARLVWLRPLTGVRHSGLPLGALWRRTRSRAVQAGASALVNSAAGQLPLLLCSLLFGAGAVGLFAMALRLLVAPLGVVGQAAAAANVGAIGRMVRAGDAAAVVAVRNGMRDLLVIGLLPCAAVAALGTWGVPLLLGARWAPTGVLVAYLSAGALAQFVAAPFSQLLTVTGRSRWLLSWDVARFVLVLGSFGLTAALGGSLALAVGVHSLLLVVLYVALARTVLAAVGRARG